MTLQAFHIQVIGALRRGGVDALVPMWTESAALWLEQNYTFRYMERTLQVTLDPLSDDSNLIDVEDRIKTVQWVRAVSRNAEVGGFYYLRKIDAQEVASVDRGDPNYYWTDGMQNIWLDSRPQLPLTIEVGGALYTDWPQDVLAVPTLLRYYKNLLMAQTMIEAATSLKDDRMLSAYNGMFERAIAAVLTAEEEARRADTEVRMQGAW